MAVGGEARFDADGGYLAGGILGAGRHLAGERWARMEVLGGFGNMAGGNFGYKVFGSVLFADLGGFLLAQILGVPERLGVVGGDGADIGNWRKLVWQELAFDW